MPAGKTRGTRVQVRPRPDGDMDYREIITDEFGRERWSGVDVCPVAYWRAEGVIL